MSQDTPMLASTRQALGSGRRGMLFVVALMLMLTLASVAMVMVTRVHQEVNYAGNHRRGAIAHHVAEGGGFTVVGLGQSQGKIGFLAELTRQTGGDVLNKNPHFRPVCNPSDLECGEVADTAVVDYFDLTATGTFGPEGAYAEADRIAAASTNAPFTFEVAVGPTQMVQPVVGYNLSGTASRCRYKYSFDSGGNVTDHDVDGADTTGAFGAWKRVRALINIGPLACDKAAGNVGTTGP